MWPWSATALKEQLDRIERNQLRIAAALKITSELEQPPLGVPARVRPVPRRKLTEADVHFVGRPPARPPFLSTPVTDPAPAAALTLPQMSPIEIIPVPETVAPLASSAPERPLVGQGMHWRDSGATSSRLP